MARCSQRHQELDEHGIGLCSKPMWNGYGGEAGFCDRPAYSKQRPEDRHNRYVPYLACLHHGGEGPRFARDGNMWAATTSTFTNLQESIAGFGETKEEAEADLLRQHREELAKARSAA